MLKTTIEFLAQINVLKHAVKDSTKIQSQKNALRVLLVVVLVPQPRLVLLAVPLQVFSITSKVPRA